MHAHTLYAYFSVLFLIVNHIYIRVQIKIFFYIYVCVHVGASLWRLEVKLSCLLHSSLPSFTEPRDHCLARSVFLQASGIRPSLSPDQGVYRVL